MSEWENHRSVCRWCGASLLRDRKFDFKFLAPEKVARHQRSMRHKRAVEKEAIKERQQHAMRTTVTR